MLDRTILTKRKVIPIILCIVVFFALLLTFKSSQKLSSKQSGSIAKLSVTPAPTSFLSHFFGDTKYWQIYKTNELLVDKSIISVMYPEKWKADIFNRNTDKATIRIYDPVDAEIFNRLPIADQEKFVISIKKLSMKDASVWSILNYLNEQQDGREAQQFTFLKFHNSTENNMIYYYDFNTLENSYLPQKAEVYYIYNKAGEVIQIKTGIYRPVDKSAFDNILSSLFILPADQEYMLTPFPTPKRGYCGFNFYLYEADTFSICYPKDMRGGGGKGNSLEEYSFSYKNKFLSLYPEVQKKSQLPYDDDQPCMQKESLKFATYSAERTTVQKDSDGYCHGFKEYITKIEVDKNRYFIIRYNLEDYYPKPPEEDYEKEYKQIESSLRLKK